MCLWRVHGLLVNECVFSGIYLFVSVNRKPASWGGSVILRKQWWNVREGEKTRREGKGGIGRTKRREMFSMSNKDPDSGPGGTTTANIPHLELVAKNLMLARTAGKGGGGSSSTGNTLPAFIMSNTSLCVTCHLRDTFTSSPLPTSHTRTHYTDTITRLQTDSHSLTYWLPLLPAFGSVTLQDPACPHMEAFGPAPSLISPLPLWLKQAGHFCGGGREGGRKNKGRRGELLPNFRRCSRQVTQTCLPVAPSILLSPSLALIVSLISSMLGKRINII